MASYQCRKPPTIVGLWRAFLERETMPTGSVSPAQVRASAWDKPVKADPWERFDWRLVALLAATIILVSSLVALEKAQHSIVALAKRLICK
jgi:hypothetical protein